MFAMIIMLISTLPFILCMGGCAWIAQHPNEVNEIEKDFIDSVETISKTTQEPPVPDGPRPYVTLTPR